MPVIKDVLDSLKIIEDLHWKKNDDYASDANPFSNFDLTAEGIRNFKNPKDVAFAWPIYNKLARLSNLLSKDTPPNNESIEDSLVDIAVYALIWKADIKRRNEPLVLKPNVQTFSCKQCHNSFSHEPKAWNVSGIPAITYFFCSQECMNKWTYERMQNDIR